MSTYVDRQLKDITDYFPGSVKTFSCPPEMQCLSCGGSGRCWSCAGKGEIRCDNCGGKGVLRCSRCGGGGVCQHCDGRGYYSNGEKCGMCSGSGRCSSCNGSGTTDCYRCSGKGFNKCYSCSGSGNCSTCHGSGLVTCSRCKGTGFYQQYLKYTASITERQYCHPGFTPELLEGLRMVDGDVAYLSTAAAWKRAKQLDFDRTDEKLNDLCKASPAHSKHTSEFCSELKAIKGMNDEIEGFSKYKNDLLSQNVHCTKVTFSINNKRYNVVLMGKNNVVAFNGIPESIDLFNISDIDKAVLKRTRYGRHKELAILTTYIYNLNSFDQVESRSLNLIFKHMCLNDIQRDRKLRYLRERYTSDIPSELIFKKVKNLLKSKKIVCYVWQCIAIDKEITKNELKFFNDLVRWCGLSGSEVKSLKHFANKFSTLDKSSYVGEYLDSPPVYRRRHFEFWNTVMITMLTLHCSCIIILITGNKIDYTLLDIITAYLFIGTILLGVIFYNFNPFTVYDQKEIDKVYKNILDDDEITEADYAECNWPMRYFYNIVNSSIYLIANLFKWTDILLYRLGILLKKYIKVLVSKLKTKLTGA